MTLYLEAFTRVIIEMLYTAVSRKVVQLKSTKAYATIPKGMMGCGCSLLHRQVHEFSARLRRCYEYLFACVKRNIMNFTLLLKFIGYFPAFLSALSRTLLRFFWTTIVETAVYKMCNVQTWEGRWPDAKCLGLQIDCVLWQDTLLSE